MDKDTKTTTAKSEPVEKKLDPAVHENIILPQFYKWNAQDVYDYEKDITDYSSFEELENVLVKARKAVFIINQKLTECERTERRTKKEYERKLRREYLKSTEKTDSARKAIAELHCEDIENKHIAAEQLKWELIRTSNAMKNEIQTLQTLSYNLRTMLKSS